MFGVAPIQILNGNPIDRIYIGWCWLALGGGEMVGIIILQSFILKPRRPVIYSMSLIVSGGSDLWRAKSLFNHIKMKIMEVLRLLESWGGKRPGQRAHPLPPASISINKRLSNADSVSSRQQMDCLIVPCPITVHISIGRRGRDWLDRHNCSALLSVSVSPGHYAQFPWHC